MPWLSLISYSGLKLASKLLIELYSMADITNKLVIKDWIELFDNILSEECPEERNLSNNLVLLGGENIFMDPNIESDL